MKKNMIMMNAETQKTGVAQERGIYAASAWPGKWMLKRHECHAPETPTASLPSNATGLRRWCAAFVFAAAVVGSALSGAAQNFLITNDVADAFLASGSADNPKGANLTANNYGGAGQLAIAPSTATNGEFDTVLEFNTAAAVSALNAEYGAGNWTISGLMLSLAGNPGTQNTSAPNNIFNAVGGGNFNIDWIPDVSWTEGSGNPSSPSGTGVNFNSISTLLQGAQSLGAYTFTPPGNNVYANYNLELNPDLVTNAAGGELLSLYFYATNSTVSYLINSRTAPAGSADPELTIDVTVTPEPATMTLLAISFGSVLCWRARNRKA
jgi:hypothetical protein